jgi:Putative phage tail protein
VRNVYQFTLGQRHILLDPMDIVTLTDASLGLNKQWVRITEITEDDTANLQMSAEEYLAGTGSAALYTFGTSSGYAANYNAAPPNTNAPIVFAAPVALAQLGLEIWIVVSGGANWGGCDVWVSSDGSTYKQAAHSIGGSRQGVLTATLPAGSDPDTTDTLAVDLSMSAGTLLSGTQADADGYHTLCYVDGELASYQTAALTSGNQYTLSYLRRGAYGTAVGQHLSGAGFARLDNSIITVPYTADQIGKTLYLKFPAFNIYGGGAQTLAQVAATQIALPAPPPPPSVANFSAVQNGEVVTFTWASVSDNAVVGYDIRYGPFGVASWDAMLPLTEAAKSTEMANASVPAGTWTFAVRARDVANQLSPLTTMTSLQVVNTYGPVSSLPQAPGWSAGTLAGFVAHYTGVLVPDSTSHANADTGFAVFDNFVWNPVAQATYTAPPVPFAKLALLRVWASMAAALGPGAHGKANPLLYIRWSQNLSGDPPMWATDPATAMWATDPTTLMWTGLTGWTLWTKGTILTTFVQQQLVVNTADGLPIIQQFTPVVDQPPLADGANCSAVQAGGQRINFANLNFLAPPAVTVSVASVTGGGAGTATATAVDANGFTAHVFNSAGSDAGGTINWSAHD